MIQGNRNLFRVASRVDKQHSIRSEFRLGFEMRRNRGDQFGGGRAASRGSVEDRQRVCVEPVFQDGKADLRIVADDFFSEPHITSVTVSMAIAISIPIPTTVPLVHVALLWRCWNRCRLGKIFEDLSEPFFLGIEVFAQLLDGVGMPFRGAEQRCADTMLQSRDRNFDLQRNGLERVTVGLHAVED